MAQISLDNGQTHCRVDELTEGEVRRAIECISIGLCDEELREITHAQCSMDGVPTLFDNREWLEAYAAAHHSKHGTAWVME